MMLYLVLNIAANNNRRRGAARKGVHVGVVQSRVEKFPEVKAETYRARLAA